MEKQEHSPAKMKPLIKYSMIAAIIVCLCLGIFDFLNKLGKDAEATLYPHGHPPQIQPKAP